MAAKKKVVKGLKNAKDAISEAGHRSNAEGEQAKRKVVGRQMTLSEKTKSVANQAKETTQAEDDRAKRKTRKKT